MSDEPRIFSFEAEACRGHSGGSHRREAVAEYLFRNREIVRKRIIRKLRSRGFQSLDPDDLMSSVLRRIDLAVLRGVIRTECEREFWAYVLAVTDHIVIARGRNESSRCAAVDRWVRRRLQSAPDDGSAAALFHRMLMTVDEERDRELLLWRLAGTRYPAIAAATGRSEVALRTQWMKIKKSLRRRFSSRGLPAD